MYKIAIIGAFTNPIYPVWYGNYTSNPGNAGHFTEAYALKLKAKLYKEWRYRAKHVSVVLLSTKGQKQYFI